MVLLEVERNRGAEVVVRIAGYQMKRMKKGRRGKKKKKKS